MMEEKNLLHVNPLPGPTWNWLKVNDIKIEVPEDASEALAEVQLSGGISDSEMLEEADFTALSGAESGMGASFAGWIAGCPVDPLSFTTTVGMEVAEPAVVRVFASAGEVTVNRYQLVARRGSEMTVVMVASGNDVAGNGISGNGISGNGISAAGSVNGSSDESDSSADRAVSCVYLETRIKIEDGAKVHLVQVADGGDAVQTGFDVAASLGKESELTILHISMGEKKALFGVAADLAGDKSSLNIDTAYIAGEEQLVDINYVARHRGKNTDSKIRVNGVLKEGAEKTFRGTIDFIRGAVDATGDEREDVLLLGENVVNKTVPLILCQEEDVEGSHGATIGDLSEETLYYFRSRGIPDEEAYQLMAAGRLTAAVRQIPEESIRKELLVRLGEDDGDE